MKKLLSIAVATAFLHGCAGNTGEPGFAADHPANPDAKQAVDAHQHSPITIADSAARPAAAAKNAVPYPLDVCIVSGEELGSMGKPVSFIHEGREIKLCCKSCEPQFRKEPAAFLKKLDEAMKKQPAKPAKPAGHEHH